MTELDTALEYTKLVVELAERGEREHARAEGLARRNGILTALADLALGTQDEERKESLQKAFGAGIEGRVKALISRLDIQRGVIEQLQDELAQAEEIIGSQKGQLADQIERKEILGEEVERLKGLLKARPLVPKKKAAKKKARR